jgi:hypothetical protein
MAIKVQQVTFGGGELSPDVYARVDTEAYFRACRRARNVYITPQGPAVRREGLKYIATAAGAGRLVPFEFNTVQKYMLLFTNARMEVYKNGVYQTAVTSSPITNITTARLTQFNFTQSADKLFIVHPDFQPIEITRTSDTAWTAANVSFVNISKRNFPDTAGSPTNEVQRLTFSYSNANDTFQLELEGELTDAIVVDNHEPTTASRIQTALRALSIVSNDTTCTHISGGIFEVTFTGQDGGRNWSAMIVKNIVSSANMGLSVTTVTQGGKPTEDVWSASRGWPVSVTFHQGRLWFGGSKSLPQTVWASTTGSFFDFNTGAGLDNQAIEYDIDDNQVNAIQNIVSGRDLQIFTSGGEFYARGASTQIGFTPDNFEISRQTNHGSSKVRPISVDGSTIFCEESGNTIRRFLYNELETSYSAESVTDLASHLISTPVAMAVRRSGGGFASDYVYIVNTTGTCAVMGTRRSQNFLAFSLFNTDGNFEDAAALGSEVYFLVNRGGTRYLEVLNSAHYMDSSVRATNGSPTTSWGGLGHLNGVSCAVRGDKYMLNDATPSSGSITSSEAVSDIEVGRPFYAELSPLYPDVNINGRLMTGELRGIAWVNILGEGLRDYTISNGTSTYKVEVDNTSEDVFGVPPQTQDGWYKSYMGGYGREPYVTITQTEPLEFKIKAITIGMRA